MKFAMFDAKDYDKASFERFNQQEDIEIKYFDARLSDDTVALAEGSDGVIVFVNDIVNETVINELHKMGVKLILLRCAGFNNVDLNAALGKLKVFRVPAYSPYAVAEHAMALILSSVRNIHKAYNRTRDFNFSLSGLTGFDLHGKTIGVIGTGRIGKIMINIATGFGMKVIAHDIYPDKKSDIDYVPLEELYRRSDIISLHCPLTPETNYIINEDSIAQMKPGVVLVNTSRGGLINTDALIDGIKKKIIGAAGLDVYEEEANIFFHDFSNNVVHDDKIARLISMPNVIVTSHQAFLTNEALGNIASVTIQNIKDFMNDKNDNEICMKWVESNGREGCDKC